MNAKRFYRSAIAVRSALFRLHAAAERLADQIARVRAAFDFGLRSSLDTVDLAELEARWRAHLREKLGAATDHQTEHLN